MEEDQPYIARSGVSMSAEACDLLVREWPGALGNLLLMSRREPRLLGELPERELSILDTWGDDPIEAIHDFLYAALRMQWDSGEPLSSEVDYQRAVYILAYLARSQDVATEIVGAFAPVLRPGLWDREFRLRLNFAFFDIASGLVWDADEVPAPEPTENYEWPSLLNDTPNQDRLQLLAIANVPPLEDPARPEVAPWNSGWMNLSWLW